MLRAFSLLALISLLSSCGGGPTTTGTDTTSTTGTTTPTGAGGGEPTEQQPNPWLAMDTHGLRNLVLHRARTRIGEVQADFDVSKIAEYREDHDTAPELSGRAVERLFDLVMVHVAAGELDEAEKTIRLIRARARNRNSAFAGTTLLAETARRKAGDDEEAQKTAIAAVLRELPRQRFGSATVVFQLYQNQEQVTARLEHVKTQMLSLETGSDALFLSEILPAIVDARERFLAAIEVVQGEIERQRAPRDYRFQTIDMTRAPDTSSVNIGVWDVGTNPELFERQLFTNSREQANGQDDDENGLVDDIHGVVSDGDAPHTALLYQPDAAILERYTPFLRGIMDLRAGMASTEHAQQVLELVREATSVEALLTLERNLDAVGEWAHGTHVAGIMVAGNPKARLAVFRSAWAGEARVYYHRGPTDEELAAERANGEAIAAFINAHDIKVVNASLGFGSDYVEQQLRHESDRYQNDEQVRARAAEIHAHRTETWRSTIAACPNTLFVVAAGNSNRDVVEYGDVPASLELANLLVVGAVDKWGNWATFTNSNPERVQIFDHGVEVDSLIPNGERVPLSGTSMAAPNVANLAGKMYAVDAAMTPQQAIEIILGSGDPIEAPFNGRIANERRAITRARMAARRR